MNIDVGSGVIGILLALFLFAGVIYFLRRS
jgi:hypothetical protein